MHHPTPEAIFERLSALSREARASIVAECLTMAGEEDLQIGGVAIPFFHVPLVLESTMVDRVLSELDRFVDALVKLELHALSDRGQPLRERLMRSLTPGGRHLVAQSRFESEYSLRRRFRRIDGFFDPERGSYRIIEVNQAAPLANHYHDAGQRISAHALRKMGFEVQPRLLAPHLLDWVVGEYRHRNGLDAFPRNIALVIEHGYPPKFTDLPRIARACEELAKRIHGRELRFHTCFPYQIRLEGDCIDLEGTEIDLIWRNSVYMTSYREQGLPIGDYEMILGDPERFLAINAGRSWLTRTKELFAVIWNDGLMREAGFSADEIASLRALVPPTFNLGHSPERADEIRRDKDRWISKPTDSGFGKGIEFGCARSVAEWAEIVRERSCDGFVFQERIACPTRPILEIDGNGDLHERMVEFDFNPHHVNGGFPGTALVRSTVLSSGQPGGGPSNQGTMNLVGGGRLLPLLLR